MKRNNKRIEATTKNIKVQLDIVRSEFEILTITLESLEKNLNQLIEDTSNIQYNEMEYIEVGEHVECVFVHNRSKNFLTLGERYKVLRIWDNRFYIKDDQNKTRKFIKKNSQFKAIEKLY